MIGSLKRRRIEKERADAELRDLGIAYEHANAALYAATLPKRAWAA